MNCPNCGRKIGRGMLLCSYCGTELKLIPDYIPQIEDEISDGLSDLDLSLVDEAYADEEYIDEAYEDGEYIDEGYEDEEYIDEAYENELYPPDWEEDVQLYVRGSAAAYDASEEAYDEFDAFDEFDEEYDDDHFDEDEDVLHQLLLAIRGSRFRWLIIAGLILLLALLLLGARAIGNQLLHERSQAWQLQQAKEAAAAGDYSEAVSYMEKAIAIDSKDASLKFTLVDYYFADGADENALLMLWEIINARDVNSALAYRRMIEYYTEAGNYAMVEEILNSCEDETILSQFGQYSARAPEFSDPPGVYGGTIWLKLSAAGSGNIYYTLDGSEPDENSNLYTAPIYLELGIYTVKAVFVNGFGTVSDVAEGEYTIDIIKPDAPVVNPAGGEFDSPVLITAEAQKYCRIFYTSDGRVPTNESTEYVGPIPMPLGHSTILFIAYSQDNVPGEITECEYTLSLTGSVDAQSFIYHLQNYNFNSGKTSDTEGHLPGSLSRYSYSVNAAMRIDERDYYLITEYMSDSTGTLTRTNVYYLGDIVDGSLYRAPHDAEDNSFIRSEMLAPELLADPAPVVVEVED